MDRLKIHPWLDRADAEQIGLTHAMGMSGRCDKGLGGDAACIEAIPAHLVFSSKTTFSPNAAAAAATVRPPEPAPITQMSACICSLIIALDIRKIDNVAHGNDQFSCLKLNSRLSALFSGS